MSSMGYSSSIVWGGSDPDYIESTEEAVDYAKWFMATKSDRIASFRQQVLGSLSSRPGASQNGLDLAVVADWLARVSVGRDMNEHELAIQARDLPPGAELGGRVLNDATLLAVRDAGTWFGEMLGEGVPGVVWRPDLAPRSVDFAHVVMESPASIVPINPVGLVYVQALKVIRGAFDLEFFLKVFERNRCLLLGGNF